MAVVNKQGQELDLNAAREQLNRDRDAGRISKSDYNKTLKGINRIADAQRKGVSYQFTGDGVFKTTGSDGRDIASRQNAGVRTTTKIPLFGKKVSQGMGYIQALAVPEAGKPKTGDSAETGTGTKKAGLRAGREIKSYLPAPTLTGVAPALTINSAASVSPSPASGATASGGTSPQTAAPATAPAVDDGFVSRFTEGYRFENDAGDYGRGRYGVPGYTQGESRWPIQPPRERVAVQPINSPARGLDSGLPDLTQNIGAVDVNSAEAARRREMKEMFDRSLKEIANVGTSPMRTTGNISKRYSEERLRDLFTAMRQHTQGSVSRDVLKEYTRQYDHAVRNGNGAPMYKGKPLPWIQIEKGRFVKRDNPTGYTGLTGTVAYKSGGKILKFAGGGQGLEALLKLRAKRDINGFVTDPIGNRTANVKINNGYAMKPVLLNQRKTIDPNRKPPMAFNETPGPAFNKDSAINTALGAYGGLSLLTAKKPRREAVKPVELAIRPALGDEDMVNRGFAAIEDSVRKGIGELRKRTGSDLTGYVTGTTAMVDNASRAKSDLLGANSQIKRADEQRMFGEINQQKQINHALQEQDRQEKFNTASQDYQQIVQGGQGAVNNALNYGVQARADTKNKAVQLDMANKRMDFLLLSQAQKWEQQGLTPEQIEARLARYKQIASGTGQFLAKGGRISARSSVSVKNSSDPAKIKIAAGRDLSRANTELRKIFRDYSQIVSKAGLESLREFNRNIRAINKQHQII